jgi:formylglycine-generating enzyme
MNDDFLHQIRVDPPASLLAAIKAKLDWQGMGPSVTQRRVSLCASAIAVFIGVAGIAIALVATRSVLERARQSNQVPNPTSSQGNRSSTSPQLIPTPIPDNAVSNAAEIPTAAAGQAENVVGTASGAIADQDDWILIPAGNFMMGATDEQKAEFFKFGGPANWIKLEKPLVESSGPVHEVYLDNFLIFRNVVTVFQYEKFIAATGRPHRISGARFSGLHQPIVNVTWDDARSFCESIGARLPTEAEWEKAARGTHAFVYPWGNVWDAKKLQSMDRIAHQSFATYEDYDNWRNQHLRGANSDSEAKTTDVGSFPSGASPYGVMDMVGNTWEWVADWFSQAYYANSPTNNPKGPTVGERRVLRGGAWDVPAPANVTWFRETFMAPSEERSVTSFRCAKDAQ